MRSRIGELVRLLQQAVQDFGSHDGPWLAGAIAYYAAFSVFPLMLVLIAAFGLLLRVMPGAQSAQEALLALLARATEPALASQVATVLAGVKLEASFGGRLGLVTLLLGATGLFAALDGAFDRLWDIPAPAPGILPAIRTLLTQRLNAFLMLLGLGVLAAVAFAGTLVLKAISALAAGVPAGQMGWQIVQVPISVGVNALLLAVMYKVLPKPEIDWRDVWLASVLVAIVWEIGKLLLALVVIGQNYTAYGVVGAFIALMAWIYYASTLFFLGAEVVRIRCRAREIAHASAQVPPEPGGSQLDLG